MKTLQPSDTIALGLMTFALFLGAGNIIFPPIVGQAAGEHLWWAALGFLLTGVGLPLLTVVALARVGGSMTALTAPIGKAAGLVLGVAVYLCIGPFFATPRTATVSYEIGIVPFVGEGRSKLLIFTILYFGLVMALALKPGRLMDNIGKIITPVLVIGLLILGGAAFFLPAGELSVSTGAYIQHPLPRGFLEGYQTMDALGALVFGVVIVNAIRSQGVEASALHTRYTIIAGLIAALCLALVYVSLVYLGAHASAVAPNAETGAHILTAYVAHTFGSFGQVLLALVILLACLTTAVGLVSACGIYFSSITPLSYQSVVILIGLFSMAAANQGLAQLIRVAVPALYTIYPLAIALVTLNLLSALWRQASRVFIPVMLVALVFGIVEGMKTLGWQAHIPSFFLQLPGHEAGLAWALPVAISLLLAGGYDRVRG